MSGLREATTLFSNDMGEGADASEESGAPERMFEQRVDTRDSAGGDEPKSATKGEPELDEYGDPIDSVDDVPEDEEQVDDDVEREAEDAEEDDDQGQLDLSSKVKVTVDGSPVEVTLKDALEGYIRTETFHQRLNQVAEAKQVVDRERNEVGQARNMYATMLKTLTEQLDGMTPAEPNWDQRFAEAPLEAVKEKHKWETYRSQRAAIDVERSRVEREQQEENGRNFSRYVEEEKRKLAELNSNWIDPANGQKNWDRDRTSMMKTAKSLGFSDAEVNGIFDHRMILVLHKAAQYDRIKASQPKAVKPSARPLRPGSGASRTGHSGNVAVERLAKSGSISDATSLFQNILSRER